MRPIYITVAAGFVLGFSTAELVLGHHGDWFVLWTVALYVVFHGLIELEDHRK